MADDLVHGNYAFTVTDVDWATELKVYSIRLPQGNVQIGSVKHFGAQNGIPVPLSGGGHQTSWEPVTMTRYKDASTAFYDWFDQVVKEGATADTKKNPKIHCYSGDQPLFTWELRNAVPTAYSQNEANAQTHDLMTETITISYEEAVQS